MIKIEISVGELFDKISILEIKKNKIKNSLKLDNIHKEHKLLNEICDNLYSENDNQFYKFKKMLFDVNSKLWEIEDKIRIHEQESKFDEDFIKLAREVYKVNDERFNIKTLVNEYYDSDIIEEKEYVNYLQPKNN
tara:strand:+ start:922 stop:1326 length:405 start_codon:yes stop_codon:yes gene_type:complete